MSSHSLYLSSEYLEYEGKGLCFAAIKVAAFRLISSILSQTTVLISFILVALLRLFP